MPNLDEILKDSGKYADGLEITVGDVKVSLGDLRTLTTSERKALSEQMDAVSRERNEVKELATTTAGLYTKLQEQLANPPKQEVPSEFDTDAWWEPARKKISPLEATIAKLEEAIKAQSLATERAATIWAQERWKNQFEGVKDRFKEPKYKDWTFEKVRDYAATNKVLDEYGLPDIRKAAMELTREDDMERIKREAFEAGLREGSVKGRMSGMSRPTSSAGAGKPVTALDPSANFNDLGDAVASDPELMKMLSGLNALEPDEIM